MKRPLNAIMIKDQNGNLTQHSIHKTAKAAEQIIRELALEKVRNGMQTEYHSNKVYKFPDGYTLFIRKVYSDGTYYDREHGRVKHEFPIQ